MAVQENETKKLLLSTVKETKYTIFEFIYIRIIIYLAKPEHHRIVKPVLNDHIQHDKVGTFQTGGCLLLYESSTERSCIAV